MATKIVVLGPAAAELTRFALVNRRAKYQQADEAFTRTMRLVRRDAGLPDEANVNIAEAEGKIVLEVTIPEPDTQTGLALVEGADAPEEGS